MLRYNDKIVLDDMENIYCRNITWGHLKNSSILVTGASGMLATYVIYYLAYLNEYKGYHIEIYALVRNPMKARDKFAELEDKEYFHYLVQDVCETIELENDIDYIIHAAGNASPKYILSDPVGIIKANTIGTISVLEFAVRKQVKRVLYTSTREVYGKCEKMEDLSEEDMGVLKIDELRSCYPESKRMAETILESYKHQYNLSYVVARIAHSYGPGMNIDGDGRIMADLVSDTVNGRNITLKSDGTALRAFCYITDAVSAILHILLQGEDSQSYNVANETEEYAIKDVAQLLCDLYPDRGIKVVFDIPQQQSLGYSKMGRTKLNLNKLKQLGWQPQVGLREGLKRTIDSFGI